LSIEPRIQHVPIGMRKRTRLVAVAVLLAGSAAIVAGAWREFRKQTRQADRFYTSRTKLQDRTVALREAMDSLQDAELREQDYVLTGETVYFEAWRKSTQKWRDEAGVLAVQSSDPGFTEMVRELTESGDRVVAEMTAIISTYDAGSHDKALERIRKSSAITYLDQVREKAALLERFDDQEAESTAYTLMASQPLHALAKYLAALFALMLVGLTALIAGPKGNSSAPAHEETRHAEIPDRA
jgi:CHASE3 domain sensor protein